MHCKNCEATVENKFCSHCGQKTNTQRISWKNLVNQDIIQGVFNLDRGLPKTWFKIITKPGLVSHEYIEGKRKRFYNFFYLLLLLVGIKLFFNDTFPEVFKTNGSKEEESFITLISNKMQIWIISIIPLFSLISWLIYSRLKYNFLEHTIQATVTMIGCFSYFLLYNATSILYFKIDIPYFDILPAIFLLISFIVFPIYSYYKFSSKPNYTKAGKILRVTIFYILFVVMFLSYTLLFNWVFTGSTDGFNISL